MSIETRLQELGITIPTAPKAIASYIPANRSGNLVFTSGQLPLIDGKLFLAGKVGKDISIEKAGEAARISCLNALAAIKGVIGDLKQIQKIVKLGVFVASDENFYEQHLVANFASELLVSLFGEAGRHARFAVGTSSLPLNAVVEIEMIAEVL